MYPSECAWCLVQDAKLIERWRREGERGRERKRERERDKEGGEREEERGER